MHRREIERSDDLNEEEGGMRTKESARASARKHRPSLRTIEEGSADVVPIDYRNADYTQTAVRQRVCTSFAPLPTEHNTGSHDLLLSRQRTPFEAPGPSTLAYTPIQATRSPVWDSRGGSKPLSERIGSWFHLGRSSFRNCIGQRKIWLRERFKSLPRVEAEEKEPLAKQRDVQPSDMGRGPTLTEEVDSDFSFLWSRVPETAVRGWY